MPRIRTPERALFVPFVLLVLSMVAASASGAPGFWSVEPIQSSGILSGHNGTAIALDALGEPGVAFYEGTSRDLAYAEKTVSGWTTVVVDSFGDTGHWPSLDFDSLGEPHIAYFWKSHPDETSAGNLMYASRSAGIWSIATVDTGTVVGEYASLQLDSSGNPHIAYFDAGGPGLKYAVWSGSAWSLETIDGPGVGAHVSMVLDGSDHPQVAYKDMAHMGLRYAARSDSSWSIVEVASVNTNPPFTLSAVDVSLDLDSAENAHVAFRDEFSNKTMFSVRDNATWSTSVARAVGQDLHGAFHSLVIAPGDVPTLAFFDVVLGNLRLATFDGIWWSPESVTSNGLWTSMAIDDDGHTHLSFHVPAEGLVKYGLKTDVASDFELPAPASRLFLASFPNPMRTSTTLFLRGPETLPFGLRIVDARGRLVRSIAPTGSRPGYHEFAWDGRNHSGERVGAGIYFAIVQRGDERASHKIVIVR